MLYGEHNWTQIPDLRKKVAISETGALGHPELATPQKGEALIEIGVEQVVACIREIAAWPSVEPH